MMIRIKVFTIIALLALSYDCKAEQSLVVGTSLSASQVNELNSLVDSAVVSQGIVGHSVAILRNGKYLYSRSAGVNDLNSLSSINQDTIFPIYSITKLFTSALIMKLVEQGKLDINRSIGDYIEGLPKNWEEISVSSLLAHSSGLPDFFSLGRSYSDNPADVIALIEDSPFVFETDTQVQYNSTNFLLLKMLIEKLYGNKFKEVVNKEFIKPFRLRRTQFGDVASEDKNLVAYNYYRDGNALSSSKIPVLPEIMFAATGLQSSAADLDIWLQLLLSGQYVSNRTLLNAWRPYSLNNGLVSDYSFGWQLQKEAKTTAVGHYGGNILNVRHFIVHNDTRESVTVVHLNNGGQKAEFNLFEYAYDLAKTVNSEVVLDSMEFIKSFTANTKTDDIQALGEEYHEFKSNAQKQNLNTEFMINELGYRFLSNQPDIALSLFKWNLDSHPYSANAYDSYAEALLATEQLQLEKLNYAKAYSLYPTYDNIPSIIANIDRRLADSHGN